MPLYLISATSSFVRNLGAWAAVAAVAMSLFKLAWDSAQTKRDRRADVYSGAFKVALAWTEMWFRVRRRPADGSGDDALVQRFHDLQEQITYYEGWISAHSELMGKAYCEFVSHIKRASEEAIRKAWASDPCPPSKPLGPAPFDIRKAKADFSDSVRDHLLTVPDVGAIRRRYPHKPGQ